MTQAWAMALNLPTGFTAPDPAGVRKRAQLDSGGATRRLTRSRPGRAMALDDLDAPLKALMLKGLGGDAAAHAELLSRMAGLLRRFFARKIGSGDADLEDLVQETLLAIHLKRETWDRAQSFSGWAYAIARYRMIDLYRRRRIRRSEPIESAEALFGEDDPDAAAGADVERLLAELPERQRMVLKAVKLDELSTAEAAARTGMSESAVKVSVHRSLKTLMRRVRDEN